MDDLPDFDIDAEIALRDLMSQQSTVNHNHNNANYNQNSNPSNNFNNFNNYNNKYNNFKPNNNPIAELLAPICLEEGVTPVR
jgi:hypothetical protein